MDGGYKRLEIYNLAHGLAIKVHKMTMALLKHEVYEEGSQIRRSSKSVSAQIVEGFALRKYKNEYLHYLWRSYGSCEETVEHLTFLFETGSVTDKLLYEELTHEYRKLNGMMFNFIQSVERNYDTPNFVKETVTSYSGDSVSLTHHLKPEP